MSPTTKRPKPSKKSLLRIYRLLYGQYGPCNWWPGESPFEIVVGAILTQNTSWSNVEKAIAQLKKKNMLDPKKMHKATQARVAELIKPAGYFRQKAKKLKVFLDYFAEKYDYDFEAMRAVPTAKLRAELLDLWGIGPETADSILLYALEKPVFVIDKYTTRIFARLGYLEKKDDYDSIQRMFMKFIPPDAPLYNEYHACIVALGNRLCNTKPKCDDCPLRGKVFCDPKVC